MAFKDLCTVSNAGIGSDGRALLFLKSPEFPSGRNFKGASNQTREILAVALAAITTGKQVYCDIPNEAAEWSDIIQINLMSGT